MYIAFVTPHAPNDPHAYSGTTLRMRQALERTGVRVTCVGPMREHHRRRGQLRKLAYRLAGRAYERFRSPELLRGYAPQIEAAVRRCGADVAVEASSLPVAYVRAHPHAYWVDATYPALNPSERPLSGRTRRKGFDDALGGRPAPASHG